MKKLPMIKQRKKPDARLFTMLSLVALMLAVSFWGQKATAPETVRRTESNTPAHSRASKSAVYSRHTHCAACAVPSPNAS